MSPATDSTLNDPQRIIADLKRANAELQHELLECRTERDEAIEQRTATAEVLGVINSSPGDLAPVFDAILEKAHTLCSATRGTLALYDGEHFRAVAIHGYPEEVAEEIRRPYGANVFFQRIVDGERYVQIPDFQAASAQLNDPVGRAALDHLELRTWLAVPLRNEGSLLGYISAVRSEVRPFLDKEIALLENFAAQAVIAMENARLLSETREALEQQTATTDVLKVINSSPSHLAPVFDALVDTAARLCDTSMAGLAIRDGDAFRYVATRSLLPEWDAYLGRVSFTAGRGTVTGRALLERRLIHVADIAADREHALRDAVTLGELRTMLAVPLLRENEPIGVFGFARHHVEPFTDRQIALAETFAAQAVIAMENARLITETREALAQQTAAAEVLEVINSSPGNLAPVFDAILEKAHALCGVTQGSLHLYDGKTFRAVAVHNLPRELTDQLKQGYTPSQSMPHWQLLEGAAFAQRDMAGIDDPFARKVTESGIRTLLCIALRKDEMLLGQIVAARADARPFAEKEITLLQNFAAQAVIAMENARLITETREALDQQTATAEVLSVINSSPGDLQPVFDAMLEKAMRLCQADIGSLGTWDDNDCLRWVAARGTPERFSDYLAANEVSIGPRSGFHRIACGQGYVQFADIATSDFYQQSQPYTRALVDLGEARTTLSIPLVKDDAVLGILAFYRKEVRPFTDKQITLLRNFAAQAVIAMENARLLTETREALEQQTATADVLKVISRAMFDLETILDTLVQSVTRLCNADLAWLFQRDGEVFRFMACFGHVPEIHERIKDYFKPLEVPVDMSSVTGRAALEARVVQIPDVLADPEYTCDEAQKIGGYRSALGVPLLHQENVVGVIFIGKTVPQPFTTKQIELATTFGDQAVIAMENARLLGELRERTDDLQQSLEYQTATSDVLKVISRSDADLEIVLENLVVTVTRLCEADHGHLFRRQDDQLHLIRSFGIPDEFRDYLETHPFAPDRGTVAGRVALERRVIHVEDAASDPEYARSDFQRRGNLRTGLGVPLLREEALVGIILLWRSRVEPFSEKQIGLAATFADQAVIAIENARLLEELRDRQAELRVTFDNMADGVAMFDQELRLAASNRNFQELLDLPDALLTEKPVFDTYIRYLAERGEFGETSPDAEIARLRSRLSEHYSFERIRPDGTVIEVRHNPMPDGGVVLIYSDITERKRSEGEIRAARDAAEAAYRDLQAAQANLVQAQKMAALGQLTAGIAHEIKNPLNFVNNFASLSTELLEELREEVTPALGSLAGDKRDGIDETIEMLTGNLDKIVEHGQRADNIVKSMLEHSRGVSGERRAVDVNGLVEEALNLAYHGARAHDQSFNITLERDYAESLKPIELAPQEMTRVLLNLIGNGFYATNKLAKAYSDAGYRPTLSVATREADDTVEVRVRDNGTGIAAEIRDKLFQPFFTTKPTGEGTGLGLSISYDIVTQQHGGTITVESEPNSYTEFTIRLPRH